MDEKLKEQLDPIVKEIKEDVVNEVKAGVTQAVTADVMEQFKQMQVQRKDIFGGNGEGQSKDASEKEQKEKMAEYIKAVFAKDTPQVKALSEGTAADGGYVVPEIFASEIIRLAPKYGVVRRNARNYPVAGEGYKTHLPTVSGISVSRVGEGAAIPAVKPTFGQITITIKKVAAIIPMSNELLKDANVDVANLLATLSAEAFAKYEDEWGFLGKASGEGIFQNTDVPSQALGSGDVTYAVTDEDDLLSVMGKLDDDAVDGAKWYMSWNMFNALRKLEATDGHKTIQAPTAGLPATLWNAPIEYSRVLPRTTDAGSQADKKFLTIADLSYMLFADKREYSFEISNEATITDTDGSTAINLFQQDMSAVRVIERIDIQLAEPTKAFAVLKTAAS